MRALAGQAPLRTANAYAQRALPYGLIATLNPALESFLSQLRRL
jgi:hypothetical protein